MTPTINRPLSQLSSATLTNIIKRGLYVRMERMAQDELQRELAYRRLEERRNKGVN